ITTPAGNAPELQSLVTTAAGPEDLIDRAEEVMRDDVPAQIEARRSAVAGATWDARAAEVEAALGTRSEPDSDGRVTAVVVSFNTRALLERSLETLRGQANVRLGTIVVDNASADGSVEMVHERFPDVELIVLDENAGFGRANNIAFERCTSEFVLLLNSDAFMAPGALAAMVTTAQQHPEAVAVGPRLLNEDGSLQRSAWPFPRAGRLLLEAVGLHLPLRRLGLLEDLGTWAHDEQRAVDFLVGACLLIRTAPLKEVNGFDERFWLYGEEADLQKRLSARGRSVVLTPAAEVTHVAGASSTEDVSRLRHFYAGQRRFLEHHGGPLAWPMGRLALLVGSLLRRRWAVVRLAIGIG
ncbi:MAG: glycosyltransferase family 2 protein, partial [Solirubrobacterales bacterium]|nr:glycosyltransferase family 2 protein [Solirubrobacterales bacterium]